MDMTKFENGDDSGFIALVGELRRWVRELTLPNSLSVPVTSRSEPQQQGGQQQGAQCT
jgi:hypothetical protein